MQFHKNSWLVIILLLSTSIFGSGIHVVEEDSKPLRILLDADVDTDDFFALLYLLKLKQSDFAVEV